MILEYSTRGKDMQTQLHVASARILKSQLPETSRTRHNKHEYYATRLVVYRLARILQIARAN